MEVNVRVAYAECYGELTGYISLVQPLNAIDPDPRHEYGPALNDAAMIQQALSELKTRWSGRVEPSSPGRWATAQQDAVSFCRNRIQAAVPDKYTIPLDSVGYTPITDKKGHVIGHLSTHAVLNLDGTPHVSKSQYGDLYGYVSILIAI